MKLLHHSFAYEPTLAPPSAAVEYVVGGNAVFVRAGREHLSVLAPLAVVTVPGLASLTPVFKFTAPRVPADLLLEFLVHSYRARDAHGSPIEALAYLCVAEGGWVATYPEVEATATTVRPTSDAPDAYADALIEIHSHHVMPAWFSPTDDRDEIGFRLYAVVGTLTAAEPQVNVRLGVYGRHFVVPEGVVFEDPEEVIARFVAMRERGELG